MKDSPIGYRLAALAAVISGFSIYANSLAVRAIPDATLYTTLKNSVTGIAWIGLALLAAGSVVGSDVRALRFNEGAVLVLASTVMFGAGVVIARHLLSRLSTELVMSAKTSAGVVLLIGYSAVTGHLALIRECARRRPSRDT